MIHLRNVSVLTRHLYSQVRPHSSARIKKIVPRGGFGRYKIASSGHFDISDRYTDSSSRGSGVIAAFFNRFRTLFGWSSSFADQDIENLITMDVGPPAEVRGMKTLNREAFKKTVTVPTMKVPAKKVEKISQTVRKVILKIPRIKAMVELADDDPCKGEYKLVLINPETHGSLDKFTPEQLNSLKEHDVELTMGAVQVDLGYENWCGPDIIRAILPEEAGGFGGFSIIGHIVHLNLKDTLLPYKEIIGQVLLDKVVGAKTVVNKTNVIDSTYRNFQMEVIAGEPNFETFSKENGCKFDMDFSKVYWNPRLSTEHERILKLLEHGDVVYDVFAGIGPFAVPAGRIKCRVLANDLNPESYKWLEHNFRTNKVKPELYQAFNKDGRDFITTDIRKDILEVWRDTERQPNNIHITMNLPALAVEFLDAFKGLFQDIDKTSLTNLVLPRIYCYTFSKCDDPEKDAKLNVEQKLGMEFSSGDWVRRVRNVAPNKEMLCASCVLTENVLFGETEENVTAENGKSNTDAASENSDGPPEKRQKSD